MKSTSILLNKNLNAVCLWQVTAERLELCIQAVEGRSLRHAPQHPQGVCFMTQQYVLHCILSTAHCASNSSEPVLARRLPGHLE